MAVAYFYKPPASGESDVVKRSTFTILTHHDETARDRMRREGLQGPVVQYVLAYALHTNGYGDSYAWDLSPADVLRLYAAHPDWFLHDSVGNAIIDRDDGYLMDPGSAGFAWWALDRLGKVNAAGWDGVFLDNLDGSLGRFRQHGLSFPAKYPTDAAWRAAIVSLLTEFGGFGFGPGKAKPLYANLTEGAALDQYDYMAHLDGGMDESFALDWRTGYLTPDQLGAVLYRYNGLSKSKTQLLVSQGVASDVGRARFAFGCYLLIKRPGIFFRYADYNDYGHLYVWDPDGEEAKLGAPTSTYAKLVDGTYVRGFEHGSVKVDPKAHTVQFGLPIATEHP